MWPFTPVVETLLPSSNEILYWHRQTHKRMLLTRESSVCHWLLREADPSCSLSQWLRRLPIGPCVITGINSLLSMATPCVTQWGIPGHVGITSTGLNGSPFPVVKITCSNLLQVGEGEFDNNNPGKNLQHSRNKEQRKRRKKMSNSVSPVGPEFKVYQTWWAPYGPKCLSCHNLFVCLL